MWMLCREECWDLISAGDILWNICWSCRFRVFCHWLCNHSYFGNFILACIMISSALLVAEDPLNIKYELNQVRIILISIFIFLNVKFFILDSSLLWLHFYNNLHDRVVPQDDIVRVHPSWRGLPALCLQCPRPCCCLRLFDIHIFQVSSIHLQYFFQSSLRTSLILLN